MILPRQARDKLKENLRTTTRSSCFLQALAEYQTFLRTDIAQEVRHADRQAEQTRNALCPLPGSFKLLKLLRLCLSRACLGKIMAFDDPNTRKRTHIRHRCFLLVLRITAFLSHVYIKTIILPRQVRDKHRETTPKNPVFRTCRLRRRALGAAGRRRGPSRSSVTRLGGRRCSVRKTNYVSFAMPFYTKDAIILPRQARDKHRESLKRGMHLCRAPQE